MPACSSPAPPRLPAWLLAALLALATILLYWPALQNGFVNYDDDRYVTANTQVQKGLTWETLRWAFVAPVAENWHPLTLLSHELDCQLWGLNPWGHHLASVLLHAVNAALVFVWLRRLTGAIWKSLVVAALFAMHPLRVESVAWVAERKDVLSGCFGLLALLAYTRYAQTQHATRNRHSFLHSRAYWLACFWFALGLMSKPMLVTWPGVLLLLDYWPLGRFAIHPPAPGCGATSDSRFAIIRRLVMEKIPFLALATAASIVTFYVQTRGAVMETIENLSLTARFENALIAYCRYLGKMFWPADLAVFYPHPGHWPVAEVFLAGGCLIAVSVVLVTRRTAHPYLLVGWLWFLGTLIPVIGLVQVGLQSMADRYTYLPSLGILILAVWGAENWTRNWRFRALPLAAAASLAIVVCMLLTRVQLQYWQDGETLFRHAIAVTQNNYIAHYNLGVALDDQGRNEAAISEYQAVLQTKPNYARAVINLGLDLDKAGRAEEALREFEQAVRVAPGNADARNNLGVALFKRGQNDEAIRQFQEAVLLAPDNPGARNSLAAALYTQGQPDEAIHQFQEALRLRPDYAEAHYNLACVLAKRRQTGDAIQHFQAAIRLKPDYTEARDGLAKILETQGK